MASLDLLFFSDDYDSLALVFGDDGGAVAPPAYEAAVSGQVTAPIGGHIGGAYSANVQRGVLRRSTERWEHAQPASTTITADYQQAQPLVSGGRVEYQQAQPMLSGVRALWQRAEPLTSGSRTGWQQGMRITSGVRAGYQQAVALASGPRVGFQQGMLLVSGVRAAYRQALHLKAGGTVGWQAGRPVSIIGGAAFQQARPVGLRLGALWQESRRPPHGRTRWPDPGGPVDPPDWCYYPEEHPTLVFEPDDCDGLALLFLCDRHGPPPQPGRIVVPVKEVYLVINSAVLIRVSDGKTIPTLGMSMSLDVDSWTWSFNASVPGYALTDLEPEDGVPVDVQATINGTAYRFLVESIGRERAFNQSALRIGGRGRAAVLDAPYAPTMSFFNQYPRTAQQLMGDVLTDNGVPLPWSLDWGLTDWLVPAETFSHQGSYISALNQIAGAVGGYLQPHNTNEVLRVLHRYPTAPWEWGAVTPDFEIPSAVATREGIEWVNKPAYNRVYVSGQQVGVLGRVTREGTAGDMLAQPVVDALITHADAARQRGRAILSDTGRIASVSLRMPVLAETGIIKPGSFVRYTDGGETRIGLTRSVQVEVGLPAIWQTIGVETHVEPV